MTSFNILMKKFEPLVKVGDEIAKVRSSFLSLGYLNLQNCQKIHPWVNLAWQALSAGMKVSKLDYSGPFFICIYYQMVQAQQARNMKILGLVRAMENTYSFVVTADELKSNHVLQDIIERILKQTIKCGEFIQDYTRRNFGGTWLIL